MKFAVIMPWPGVKNAEFEFIERLIYSAKVLNHSIVVIDNFGRIIENNLHLTDNYIDPTEIDFVLSLHYSTPKFIDSFYYHALWNPHKYILDQNLWKTYYANIIMCDSFIGYPSKGVLDVARTIIRNTNHQISDIPLFLPSVPEDYFLPPSLTKNSKMFYCGINWERISNSYGRHHNLFKMIDTKNAICIYGPEEFGGVKPWEGYKSYQGSIDFDGKSLIKVINQCGISLVISSNEHRKEGAASSRIYESAAAGAVIITDDNPFVKQIFGDSVLYFNYDYDSANNNFLAIMAHYRWILNNIDKAKDKALKAQNIIRNDYTLEKCLNNIIKTDHQNKLLNKSLFYSQNKEDFIDVVIIWDLPYINKDFYETVSNIQNQENVNVRIFVIIDHCLEKDIQKLGSKYNFANIKFFYQKIFISNNKEKLLSKGMLLAKLIEQLPSKGQTSIILPNIILHKNHYAILKRKFDDTSCDIAYSGLFTNTSKKSHKKEVLFFENINLNHIVSTNLSLSQCLISNSLLHFYKNEISLLDQGIVNLLLAHGIQNNKLSFSKRMTCCIKNTSEFSLFQPITFSDEINIINHCFDNSLLIAQNNIEKNSVSSNQIVSRAIAYLNKHKIKKAIFRIMFGKTVWKELKYYKKL